MSWQLAAFTLLALVLAGGFVWYERARPPARLVALVAALAALAVAGRLVLAPVPNVVATTDIALITGYALGPAPGFAVGALAAPISNIWLGQGPWTAWQMAGWGLAGLGGAWLAMLTGRRLGRLWLAAACGAAGLAYGALLDLSVMVTYGGEQSLDRYLALSARGVPFNVAHALGNVAFALAAGPALVRMISRYRTRLEFTWRPAGALPLVLIAAIAIGLSAASSARAAPTTESWLAGEQNPDGGYGASPDVDSNPAMTGWTMMGLEAAGVNPLDVRRGGRTPVSYLRSRADGLRSVNDLERTILALEGAGVDSRRFAGTDLVAELRSRRDRDGSVSGQVNLTAFYALAMRAAGVDPARLGRPSRWLRDAQNRDGGWGYNPGSPSDPDSTGAALQALAATGAGGNATAAGARWLHRSQRANGGWGLATSGVVNAQSTAWAVQGLVAVSDGGSSLREGLAYLDRMRVSDGHYRYSSASDQTPVWVTAQVLLAVKRQPLPLPAVARKPPPDPSSDSPASSEAEAPDARAAASPAADEAARRDGGAEPSRDADRKPDDEGRSGSGSRSRKPESRAEPAGASARPAAATFDDPAAVASPAAEAEDDDDDRTGLLVAVGAGALALGGGYLLYRRRRS
jgi:LPXTG-motif cell wall-anchored protein